MTTMSLTALPTELLDEIILRSLPESFENLALTCKGIYELCTPFIEHHNTLRAEFQNFNYSGRATHPSPNALKTAWDLIVRIAIEPDVARYIQELDLMIDGHPYRGGLSGMLPHATDPNCGEAVSKLLASSRHLQQVGVDWEEFYAEVEEDLEERRYSQSASAFLLTLLPNVKTLKLPRLWKMNNLTHRLLGSIIRDAKQSRLYGTSLSQVTRVESYKSLYGNDKLHLDQVVPFLALPRVRSFYGPSIVAMGDAPMTFPLEESYRSYGANLEVVRLKSSCMDHTTIADFLKHTPRLKTLRYSHSTKGDPRDWDICKFITAIEREAGNQLEELCVSIFELRGSILPGKASMCNFRRLRKLEFPLEIAMCNIASSMPTDPIPEHTELLMSELVPPSVSELSLISEGKNGHEKAVEAMFRHFASKKDLHFPALRTIHLTCPDYPSTDEVYKEQCEKLVVETQKAGVDLDLLPSLAFRAMDFSE
ncbi:hypothetical protein FQN54_002309 [Arachnomyces sp. PD_36]|nr:hypothetical protein FQN54_002309 [Arachnomyces sp. PD_36]